MYSVHIVHTPPDFEATVYDSEHNVVTSFTDEGDWSTYFAANYELFQLEEINHHGSARLFSNNNGWVDDDMDKLVVFDVAQGKVVPLAPEVVAATNREISYDFTNLDASYSGDTWWMNAAIDPLQIDPSKIEITHPLGIFIVDAEDVVPAGTTEDTLDDIVTFINTGLAAQNITASRVGKVLTLTNDDAGVITLDAQIFYAALPPDGTLTNENFVVIVTGAGQFITNYEVVGCLIHYDNTSEDIIITPVTHIEAIYEGDDLDVVSECELFYDAGTLKCRVPTEPGSAITNPHKILSNARNSQPCLIKIFN